MRRARSFAILLYVSVLPDIRVWQQLRAVAGRQ